jgi:excisionase family DNA binding protein
VLLRFGDGIQEFPRLQNADATIRFQIKQVMVTRNYEIRLAVQRTLLDAVSCIISDLFCDGLWLDQRRTAEGSDVLNVQQAAAFFGVGVRVIYALAKDGKMPAVRLGDVWRWRNGLELAKEMERSVVEGAAKPNVPERLDRDKMLAAASVLGDILLNQACCSTSVKRGRWSIRDE